MNKSTFKGISDSDLQQYAANARTTWCMALGHGKAFRNECLTKDYEAELERRGLPTLDQEEGKFNGEGSC